MMWWATQRVSRLKLEALFTDLGSQVIFSINSFTDSPPLCIYLKKKWFTPLCVYIKKKKIHPLSNNFIEMNQGNYCTGPGGKVTTLTLVWTQYWLPEFLQLRAEGLSLHKSPSWSSYPPELKISGVHSPSTQRSPSLEPLPAQRWRWITHSTRLNSSLSQPIAPPCLEL